MRSGLEILLNFIRTMKGNHLSILKNASEGSITYYVGGDLSDVNHLKNCTLICKTGFRPELAGVELIQVDRPQLTFYEISKDFREDYIEKEKMVFRSDFSSYVHSECELGENVKIAPGCVIGKCKIKDDVEIHPNVTIYAKSEIGERTIIEAGTVIGSAGVMWVWGDRKRVYLEQLGDVVIEQDCRIGSLIEIVRGSANESTVIGEGTCMAHGCMIGHGCQIGKFTHLANGINFGGAVVIGDYNFVGSGVTVLPGVKVLETDVVLGAGSTITKDVVESGVYVGTPARKVRETNGKLSGIPVWRR